MYPEKIKKNLLDKGWSIDAHQLPDDVMNFLVEKKNQYLQIACSEVQRQFNTTFTGFEIEKLEFIELAKAITRALLRYENNSISLVKAIYKKLQNTYHLSSELKYCTLPYPIIHFTNYDISEKGAKYNRHKDGIDSIDIFYTTWTPLNNCFHKAMAITEYTNKKRNFIIEKLCGKYKFIENFLYSFKNIVTPDIKIGEYLIWDGKTDHEGLFNTTDQTHVALVIRFTSSPIMYEGSLSTSDLEQYIINDPKIDALQIIQKFIRIFVEIKKYAELNEKEPLPLEIVTNKIEADIINWALEPHELKKLSFMLTLYAQRMEKRDQRDKVILYYMYSFHCALDNIWGLYKTLLYVIDHYENTVIDAFIKKVIIKYPYVQTHEIIKKAKEDSRSKKNINTTVLDSKLSLLEW